jgi:hypothetical protein
VGYQKQTRSVRPSTGSDGRAFESGRAGVAGAGSAGELPAVRAWRSRAAEAEVWHGWAEAEPAFARKRRGRRQQDRRAILFMGAVLSESPAGKNAADRG